MTDKAKKDEGPACACGKADLYEEFLKNQKEKSKDKKTENSDSKNQVSADKEE